MNLILLSTLESIVESRTRAAGGPGGCDIFVTINISCYNQVRRNGSYNRRTVTSKFVVTVVTTDEQARSVLNDSFNRKHGEILDTVEKIQSVSIRFNPFLYMFCRG